MVGISNVDECNSKRFKNLIQAKLSDLDQQYTLGQAGQNTVELDQQAISRLSRQDALLNQSMAKATQDRRDAARRALVAALIRLDDGAFGHCKDRRLRAQTAGAGSHSHARHFLRYRVMIVSQ